MGGRANLEPFVDRVIVARPEDTGIASARAKTDKRRNKGPGSATPVHRQAAVRVVAKRGAEGGRGAGNGQQIAGRQRLPHRRGGPPVGAGARPGNIAAASARSAANMGATRRDVNVIPHPRWLMPLAAARSGTESRFRWHRGQGRRGAAWPRELKFPELFGKRHHAPSLRPTTRALLSQTTALSQPGVRSPKSTTFTGRPASPTQRTGSPDRRTSAIESDGFAWPHRDGRKASQRRNG